MFGKSPDLVPPALPPPPANPPILASSVFAPPSMQNTGIFGGLGASIASSPLGALDQGATQRKSLFGQ